MRAGNVGSSCFLDVEGSPIRPEDLVIDTDGNSYDISKLEHTKGTWSYNNQSLLIKVPGSITGYDEVVPWRQTAPEIAESDITDEDEFGSSGTLSPTQAYARTSTGLRGGQSHLPLSNLSLSDRIEKPSVRHTFELDHTTIFGRIQESIAQDLRESLRTKYYGYEAEVLINSVAMHCQPCRPARLSGPNTLPIFARSNFHDVSDKIFETIQPAMALAERMMLRGSMQFWIDTCCGGRDYCVDHSTGYLRECLTPLPQPTATALHLTMTRLRQMGEVMTFSFRSIDGGYAQSRSARTNQGKYQIADPFTVPHEIGLDLSLYHVIETYSRLRHPNPAAKLRFDFFLAVVLCHEIAHAFETKCGGYWYLHYLQSNCRTAGVNKVPYRTHEAFWQGDNFGEAGSKWEIFTFGDRIKPINHGCDIRHGLVLYNGDWFDCNLFDTSATQRTRDLKANSIVISMGYIEEIQQEDFWCSPGPRNLRPPRIGPRNIFTGTDTSTMSWRRYLLEKEETKAYPGPDAPVIPAAIKPTIKASEGLKSRARKLRRHLQTPIQIYGEDYIYDSQIVQHAMQSFADYEQIEHKKHQAIEEAADEARRRYTTPGPDQADIHQYFRYPGSPTWSTVSIDSDEDHDNQSAAYDALRIAPDRLRLPDKWLLTEELFCLSEHSDSATFLAHRAKNTLGLSESSPYNPQNPDSWSATEMEVLAQLRQANPSQAFPVVEARKREARRQNKERWRTINEMEELAVYLGHSRIEFERTFARGQELPLGMTVETFDHDFGELLEQKRREYRSQDSANYTPYTTDMRLAKNVPHENPNFFDIPAPAQSNTLDQWLASARKSATVMPTTGSGPQAEARIPRGQLPIPTKTLDRSEYERLQRAATQGSSGLYSFLRG